MRVPKLLQTSSVRFAALYALVFCASAALLFAFIYETTVRAIDIEIDTALDTEVMNLSEVNGRMGLPALMDVLRERSTDPENNDSAYLLVDPSLRPIVGNLPAWPADSPIIGDSLSFSVDEQVGDAVVSRVYRAHIAVLPGAYRLLVAHGVDRRVQVQKTISRALAWGLGAALFLGIAGGLLSGRGLLRRTRRIAETSERIMAGDLAERIAITGANDELDRLAIQLNLMLERIEQLVEGMRMVGDSVAHDLRTPLARLKGAIEAALRGPPDTARYRVALEEALTETDRALSVFNAVVSIAQARSSVLRGQMEPLDLAAIVGEAVELYEPAIEARGLALELHLPAQRVAIRGHRQLLSQALANLLDNAVKFSPGGGSLRVNAEQRAGYAVVEVADTGPGIPAGSRARMLLPYARGETCGGTPGTGLGLSLVAAVASLHRATLTFDDNAPGLRVTMCIPLEAPKTKGAGTR